MKDRNARKAKATVKDYDNMSKEELIALLIQKHGIAMGVSYESFQKEKLVEALKAGSLRGLVPSCDPNKMLI